MIHWLSRIALLSATSALAFGSGSCTVESPDAADDTNDDSVGEAQQEFGEAACGTTTNWDVSGATMSSWAGGNVNASSPNNAYGHAPSCPNQYEMEVIGPAAADIARYSVSWIDGSLTNPSECSNAHLAVTGYEFGPLGGIVGPVNYTGHPGIGSACIFQRDDGGVTTPQLTVSCQPTPPNKCGNVAVAGRAWSTLTGSVVWKKVRVSVGSP